MLKTGTHRVRGFCSSQPLSDLRQGDLVAAQVSGALYWPGEDALIVADLHLEKGSALCLARQHAAAL